MQWASKRYILQVSALLSIYMAKSVNYYKHYITESLAYMLLAEIFRPCIFLQINARSAHGKLESICFASYP